MARMCEPNDDLVWQLRKQYLITQPLAHAFAASAVPTVLADAALDGRPVVFVNTGFLRLTGRTEDAVLGLPIHQLDGHPGENGALAVAVAAALAGKSVEQVDIPYRRPDGETFWAETSVAPIFDPEGRVAYLVATFVDVTGRMAAAADRFETGVEERTAALTAALEESDLLSREITHRTKNALALLAALIEAKRRRADDPRMKSALADIAGRVRSIARLQSLLDGIGSERNGVPLARLMAALAEELDAATDVRVVLVQADPAIVAPPTALSLSLAVTELVLNAQEHAFTTGQPGRVELAATVGADGEVCVSVSDDGVGLPEGFRVDAPHGLGMLMLRDRASRLNGRIEAGPSAAGGACFRFIFRG